MIAGAVQGFCAETVFTGWVFKQVLFEVDERFGRNANIVLGNDVCRNVGDDVFALGELYVGQVEWPVIGVGHRHVGESIGGNFSKVDEFIVLLVGNGEHFLSYDVGVEESVYDVVFTLVGVEIETSFNIDNSIIVAHTREVANAKEFEGRALIVNPDLGLSYVASSLAVEGAMVCCDLLTLVSDCCVPGHYVEGAFRATAVWACCQFDPGACIV